MAETLRIGWRQYRLERKMFWRNPVAAFFNFALPLIFLALTIPLTRLTDWLIARNRRRELARA